MHSSYRSHVPSSVKALARGGGMRNDAQDRRRSIAGGAPFPVSHAASVAAPATSVPCVRPERYASHREGAIGIMRAGRGRSRRAPPVGLRYRLCPYGAFLLHPVRSAPPAALRVSRLSAVLGRSACLLVSAAIDGRGSPAVLGCYLSLLYEAVTGPAAVFHLKLVPDVPPISPATQNWLVVPGWGAAAL